MQNTFNEPTATITENNETPSQIQNNILSSSNSSSMSSIASSINSFNTNRPGTSTSLNELNANAVFGSQSTTPFSAMNRSNELSRTNQQLPNVNIFSQRTLSYNAPNQQLVVPNGLFQWSIFIVMFPFKLIVSSLKDLATFFLSLFKKHLNNKKNLNFICNKYLF